MPYVEVKPREVNKRYNEAKAELAQKYDLRWRKERGLMIHEAPSGNYPCEIAGIGSVVVYIENGIGMQIETLIDSDGFKAITVYDRDGVSLESREEYDV